MSAKKKKEQPENSPDLTGRGGGRVKSQKKKKKEGGKNGRKGGLEPGKKRKKEMCFVAAHQSLKRNSAIQSRIKVGEGVKCASRRKVSRGGKKKRM